MSWLIETYLDEEYNILDEEMKTAADFRKKKEDEQKEKDDQFRNTVNRGERMLDASDRDKKHQLRTMSPKQQEKFIRDVDTTMRKRYGDNYQDELDKKADDDTEKLINDRSKEGQRFRNMANDSVRAGLGALKHARKHPINDSTDMLAEMFQ